MGHMCDSLGKDGKMAVVVVYVNYSCVVFVKSGHVRVAMKSAFVVA